MTPAAEPAPSSAELVAQGKKLIDKLGCISCHTIDGSVRIGPTLKGYLGMRLEEADGTHVVGSEARFRAALIHAPALANFPSSMPSYEGMIKTADADLLVAYVRSL